MIKYILMPYYLLLLVCLSLPLIGCNGLTNRQIETYSQECEDKDQQVITKRHMVTDEIVSIQCQE